MIKLAITPTESRCRGCGKNDLETATYMCRWPDGRVTFERHCGICWMSWRRRFEAWGATVTCVHDGL